ncbi:hypothetical protein ACFWP3_28045 [Streptomyces sp. NPDC058525]|uniref:hypothetical protein n=1 Tax=unclassified Streptomyces TaxID=2593676 RepID=UPI00364CD9F3
MNGRDDDRRDGRQGPRGERDGRNRTDGPDGHEGPDGHKGHEGRKGHEGYDGPGVFEVDLREWMARDAAAVRPAAVPYPAIVRQGRAERRRRLAVAGAALIALAVVPATALAFAGDGTDGGGGGPADRVLVAGGGPTASAPPTARPPAGPAAPATPGQLADGITMEEAAAGLRLCLGPGAPGADAPGSPPAKLGEAAQYRILLAQRSTGNDNSPGDGRYIVAVRDAPVPTRIICSVKDGQASGSNISMGGSDADPEDGPVVPDMNAGKLYLQRMSSEGPWKLPFRWGSIGTVDPGVTRVTVSYGGSTSEAAVDRGWFAATGVLQVPVSKSPRIKGYDAQGRQVYDSDQDRRHEKTIP